MAYSEKGFNQPTCADGYVAASLSFSRKGLVGVPTAVTSVEGFAVVLVKE
jgi:hypothetical protein